MTTLFTPGKIGSLELNNRLVRSATAECMADQEGLPLPILTVLYEELASGGVGMIITGHMYIHPSGKAHAGMTGVYSDDFIPRLSALAQVVHENGSMVVAQINHGGMQCDPEVTQVAIAPSAIDEEFLDQPAREITLDEIDELIAAYAKAARRVKLAGFDGVQIHAAHGYLISQFLSPYINHRRDRWGGDLSGRMRFLGQVCREVRNQVGVDYPVLIKLGLMDGVPGGLSIDEGVQIVSKLKELGIDAIEISGGIGGKNLVNVRKGIRSNVDEGYFLPLVSKARLATNLPIITVGGFRSRQKMEQVLLDGDADYISLCRPLISEPDLPNQFLLGVKEKSRCISSNNCWPERDGIGIACKCPHELV